MPAFLKWRKWEDTKILGEFIKIPWCEFGRLWPQRGHSAGRAVHRLRGRCL